MSKSSDRILKTNIDRLRDLEFHLWELFRALIEVSNGDQFYIKNIATILRAIVVEKPGNNRHQPLLVSLAREYKIHLPLSAHLIPILSYQTEEEVKGDFLTPLERYIQKDSVGVWFEGSGATTRRTLRDLILAIAETDGLAHEDRSIEEWLLEYKKSGKYRSESEQYIYSAGFRVFKIGLEFLVHLYQGGHFELTRSWNSLNYESLKPHLFENFPP